MSKILKFDIDNFELQPMDDSKFLKCKFYAIATNPNRNDSSFTLESLEDAIPSVYNSPILAYWQNGDFVAHNSDDVMDYKTGQLYSDYQNGERPIGIIPESSTVQVEEYLKDNWLTFTGLIWVEYNKLIVDLLAQRKINKTSVEVLVLESHIDENGIEVIDKFQFLGITLLGEAITEGIENSHLDVLSFAKSRKFKKFVREFNSAYKQQQNTSNSLKEGENKKVFDQLSMNELNRSINKILDQYTYDVGDDWTRNKYWVEDIKGTNIIAFDQEEETYYLIPYSIDENNEVHLDMDNMVEAEYEATPKQKFSQSNLFIAKDKLGTKDTLVIDKSKDSMSDSAWGDVDKSQLKKDCLTAKNYKAVCKAVFLKLEDGWLDGKEGSLGYPVMQKSGDKVIYNRYGLAAAKAESQKNNESAVLAKVNAIYKKLGLDDQKKEEQSLKYVEEAKKAGYTFIGLRNGNLMFTKEEECMPEMPEMNDMSLYTVSFEDVKGEDKEFKSEDLNAESIKMDSSDGGDVEELAKLKAAKEELEAKYAELEKSYEAEKADKEKMASEKEELAKEQEKLTEAKKEAEEKYSQMLVKQFEAETDSIISNEDLDLEDTDREEILNMRKENKFASVEEFTKEIVYRQFVKKEKAKNNNTPSLTFGLDKKVVKKPTETNELDELIKKYN